MIAAALVGSSAFAAPSTWLPEARRQCRSAFSRGSGFVPGRSTDIRSPSAEFRNGSGANSRALNDDAWRLVQTEKHQRFQSSVIVRLHGNGYRGFILKSDRQGLVLNKPDPSYPLSDLPADQISELIIGVPQCVHPL